ncbi:MAG: AraC family transcriptional regulator [Caldibacillus sp.]
MDVRTQKKIIQQFYKARIENHQNEYIHPPYQLEQKLLTAIRMRNEKEAISALKQINKMKRAKLASDPLRSLKNSIIVSCALFTRAVIEGGMHPETAFNLSDVLIQEIERLDTREKLEKFEYNMVYTFIRTLEEEQLPKHSPIIQNAISYIHEHILHELSLEKIASDLNINPSYLSTLFKKETGTTLVEYINRKKIEESKYFLLHSELSISSIASLFRFCNQSYYTSLFKKFTGLTPAKYREMKKKII